MSELYHHQIKGAKHGVRNGPPYPLDPEDHTAEQLRLNPDIRRELKEKKTAEKAERRKEKAFNSFIKISRKASKRGNAEKLAKMAKGMTDEELKKANARLTLENTYMNLVKNNSPAHEKRMKWAHDAINEALKNVGKQVATVAFSKAVNALASKMLGEDVEIVNPLTGGVPQSKPKETPKQESKPKETPKQESKPKEKPKQESKPKEKPKKR